jgi:hypothetical protein
MSCEIGLLDMLSSTTTKAKPQVGKPSYDTISISMVAPLTGENFDPSTSGRLMQYG